LSGFPSSSSVTILLAGLLSLKIVTYASILLMFFPPAEAFAAYAVVSASQRLLLVVLVALVVHLPGHLCPLAREAMAGR
jgi:hypothetical protein